MQGYTPGEKIRYWLLRDRMPVTVTLIAVSLLTFLMILFRLDAVVFLLGFFSNLALSRPWTVVTYPLLGTDNVISLLFAAYWLWFAGGSLERSWGSSRFAVFFFLVSAITAISLFIGSMVTSTSVGLAGLWVPLAAVTVAFGMINPEQTILFMLIIPMKMKYLALLSAVVLFVAYTHIHPLLGIFSLAGCAAAYWYVRAGTRISFSPRHTDDRDIHIRPSYARRRFPNPMKWIRERRENKRLKDFLDK